MQDQISKKVCLIQNKDIAHISWQELYFTFNSQFNCLKKKKQKHKIIDE